MCVCVCARQVWGEASGLNYQYLNFGNHKPYPENDSSATVVYTDESLLRLSIGASDVTTFTH